MRETRADASHTDGTAAISIFLLVVSATASPLALGSGSSLGYVPFGVLAGLALTFAPSASTVARRAIAFLVVGACVALALAALTAPGSFDLTSDGAFPDDPGSNSLIGPRIVSAWQRGELLSTSGRIACLAATFVAALLIGQSRRRAILALSLLLTLALGIATLGLALHAIAHERILWIDKFAYQQSFTGTFVHRGANGAWAGTYAIVAVCLTMRLFRWIEPGRPVRVQLGDVWRAFGERAPTLIALLLCTGLMLVALALSRSRAAFLVTALVLGATVLVTLARSPLRPALRLALPLVLVVVLGLLALPAAEVFSDRLATSGFDGVGRLGIWTATLDGIAARPWSGWGPGSFDDLFAMVRGADLASLGRIVSAHNLPFEIAFEHGIPVALAVVMAWGGTGAWLARRAVRARQFDALATIGAAVALHSLALASIDPVTRSFGYTLPVAAIVGLAVGAALMGSLRER